MKCIRCGHDSKHKDRPNQTCPQCKHRFAFEPRAGAKLTDQAFQNAIDRVSGHGQVRWTPDHLYYEVARRLRPRPLRRPTASEIIAIVVGAGIITVGFIIQRWLGVGALLIVAGIVTVVTARWALGRRRATPRLAPHEFGSMWQTWLQVHGKPPGLIERPRQAALSQPRRPAEPDLGDYSFDRAVICDRPETVDLLLANNFHFENNCAILAIDGYPPGPFETVRAMLKRNPRLRVFALHDATVAGCQLAHRLAHDSDWFAGQAPVIDVGLRPGQAGPFRGMWLHTPGLTVLPEQGIKSSEIEWLSRYSLELAAIRPDQVLKRLYRAISRPRDDDDDDGEYLILSDGDDTSDREGYVIEDSESFSGHADADDGGADSFG